MDAFFRNYGLLTYFLLLSVGAVVTGFVLFTGNNFNVPLKTG